MNGKVIKTLAEYYANLNRRNITLENPELADQYQTDTNGVTSQDLVQDTTKEVSSEVNK